jgi:hypothetical protein
MSNQGNHPASEFGATGKDETPKRRPEPKETIPTDGYRFQSGYGAGDLHSSQDAYGTKDKDIENANRTVSRQTGDEGRGTGPDARGAQNRVPDPSEDD